MGYNYLNIRYECIIRDHHMTEIAVFQEADLQNQVSGRKHSKREDMCYFTSIWYKCNLIFFLLLYMYSSLICFSDFTLCKIIKRKTFTRVRHHLQQKFLWSAIQRQQAWTNKENLRVRRKKISNYNSLIHKER